MQKRDVPGSLAILKHLVAAAGGTVAIYGATGAILALELAGLNFEELESFGGASGGALVTILLAAGKTPRQIFKLFLEAEFTQLLPAHEGIRAYTTRRLFGKGPEKLRNAINGYFGSTGLGEYLEAQVENWPPKFWTLLVTLLGDRLIISGTGIVLICASGKRIQLTRRPPRHIGAILRGACAVPELIQLVPSQLVFDDMEFPDLDDADRVEALKALRCESILAPLLGTELLDGLPLHNGLLADGAFSQDGSCPVRTVRREFGARSQEIIAISPGGLRFAVDIGAYRAIMRGLCPVLPRLPFDARLEYQGELGIMPWIPGVGPLQFNHTVRQKLNAVLAGFEGTIRALERRKRLGFLPPSLNVPRETQQLGVQLELVDVARLHGYTGNFARKAVR
jgi:hypothetical protein